MKIYLKDQANKFPQHLEFLKRKQLGDMTDLS